MPLAIAALPVIIIALVAMIVLWGLYLLLKSLLQSMANHIPLVGGTLSRAIGAILDDAAAMGYTAARAVVGDAVGFILAPVYWIERHIVSVIDFFSNLVSAVHYIIGTLIPDEVSALEKQIINAYNSAVHYAAALENAVLADLARDVAALENMISSVESALEHYTQALVTSAEAYTTAAITAETDFVVGEVTALQTEIAHVAAADAAYAQALYTDAITYTQTLVTAAETTLATDLTGVINWTGAQVTALDAAIAAMGTQVIAFTLDAVGTVESDLMNLKEECTDNLCSGLGEAASIANALMEAGWMAALLGYMGWAIADPEGAGHGTADVLGPIAAGAADAVTAAAGAL